MFSILLLLGALAAGAGIYTLFQEPSKDKSQSPSQPTAAPSGYDRSKEILPPSAKKDEKGKATGDRPTEQKEESKATIPEVESPLSGSSEEKESIPSLKKKKSKPNLTYTADEIISNNSRYSFHRRPLLNAEALVEKEHYEGALEIYNRTNSRIQDEEINQKLGQNIQDLNEYLSSDQESEYAPDDTYGESEIPIRDLVHAIKDISEAIAQSLAKSFQVPFIPQTSGPLVQIPPEKLEEWKLDERNLDKLVSPVVYQIIQQIPEQSVPSKEEPETSPPEEDFELPEDTFFSDEWEKFKDLPLKDRRSGGERRQNLDRRTGDDRKKDRRAGEDRREKDLFKEREDYLNQKAEEKRQEEKEERKKQEREEFEDQVEQLSQEPALLDKLSEMLPDRSAIAPFTPVPLKLPEPIDKIQVQPEEHAPLAVLSEPGMQEQRSPQEEVKTEKEEIHREPIGLPEPEDKEIHREGIAEEEKEEAGSAEAPEIKPLGPPPSLEEAEAPEIEVVEGDMASLEESEPEEAEPEKIIHGVLELKPPEVDDAPFLTLTYDFSKIPDSFRLSKNYSIMEYGYYKYKPMLMKAQEFARRKMLKNALNYYRVIKSQNIPPELKGMINRNIKDITEFLEKYLMAKGG